MNKKQLIVIVLITFFLALPLFAREESIKKDWTEPETNIATREEWTDSLRVSDYYKGYETIYKDWTPFISEVNGEPIILYKSLNFLFAYTSELKKKHNVKIDAENIQLKEFDEYFSKASDDDLIINLIEEFYIEKGLLLKKN